MKYLTGPVVSPTLPSAGPDARRFPRNNLFCIIGASFICAALVTPAISAPVGDVVKACGKMHAAGQTCNYGIKGNSLVGCTDGVVFECPADGSRQCTGGKNTSGKCNEDGTAARLFPLKGDDLLNELQVKKAAE